MRIPGLTLLNAPSPQLSLACQPTPQDEAPAQPTYLPQAVEADPSVCGDQDMAVFIQATLELAPVSQDEPLPSLQETDGKADVPFDNTSADPDALDLALAEESASEPESAASDDEMMRDENPSKMLKVNGIDVREEEQCADDDGSDEGYRNIIVIRTDCHRSSSGSDSDEPMSTIIDVSQLRSMEELIEDEEEEGLVSKKNTLKTAHETIEESGPIDLTNVAVDPDAPLECLGTIERLLGSLAIVKAHTGGEYRVLNEGSFVLSGSRALVGVVPSLPILVHGVNGN
jgi:hypothetical protein